MRVIHILNLVVQIAILIMVLALYVEPAAAEEEGTNYYALGIITKVFDCSATECKYNVKMKHGTETWKAARGYKKGKLLYRKWNDKHGYGYGKNSLITPAPISGANWVGRSNLPEYNGENSEK